MVCWLLNPSLLVYTHILEPEALLIGLETALLVLGAVALSRDRAQSVSWGQCVALALVAAGLLFAAPGLAAPIVYVIQADEIDGLGTPTGNDFRLTFRYDGNTPDSNVADPQRGTFSGGLQAVVLRRNGVVLPFAGPYIDEEILVRASLGPMDGFDLFDGHIDNGPDRVSWTNEFPIGTFPDPNVLPTSFGPVLLGGLTVSGSLLGQSGDSSSFIQSVTATVVPEPSSVAVFGTGLLVVSAALRRREDAR